MGPKGRVFAVMSIVVLSLAARTSGAASATASVTLSWTAPGDDGMVGRAQAYSLRYSLAPITESNFNSATAVAGLPAPAPPGSTESFTVGGLVPNTVYYFAIKTRDEAFNWSPLSNVLFLAIPTTGVGDAPTSTSFSSPWPNPARTSMRFTLMLSEASGVQVDAFGVDGRRVRRLADGRWPAGRWDLVWNLRDEAGNRVPAGIYLVRARIGNSLVTKRAVVAR